MAFENNQPTFTYIKWSGVIVTYNQVMYPVQNAYSCMKYIYWESDNPYMFRESNVRLKESEFRYLVAINDKGIYTIIPQDNILVIFDGENPSLITEHIWGLHETNKETGNKFVAIEQNIEGIKQTVGTTNENLGNLTEKVSQIEQTATEIDLSVKELSREYDDNKALQKLREDVNISIIDINSSLGVFKSKINEYFKDNEIDSLEGLEIESHIEILNDRREKLFVEIDKVISLVETQEDTSRVLELNNKKNAVDVAITNLINLINTAISDNTIVPSEATLITDAFGKCNVEINKLKNTVDEVIFLGSGGKITEELANINIKSDEIALSVSKVEETVKNDTEFIKGELVEQIKDVNNALGSLESTMNGAFLDGALSEAEKISIRQNLQTLSNEKTDVDKQYEVVYANENLIGTAKEELKTSYDNYIEKYNSLISTINGILNKEDLVNEDDKTNLDNAFSEHRVALGGYTEKVNSAIDSIAKKISEDKANTVDKKYADILLTPDGIVNRVGRVETTTTSQGTRLSSAESEIRQLADKITSTVTIDDVKSVIEQSPTEIKYGFNDISDYVTIGTYGLTVNRGAIACHTLTTPSGEDPIIKLFPNGGESCSIDATLRYETGGIGDSIRLKWNAGNYLRVSDGNCAFHMDGTQKFSFYSSSNSDYIRTTKGEIGCSSSGLLYQNKYLAFSDHTHTGYALSSHNHGWSDISGKPSSFTPSGHQHNGLSGGSYGTYIDSGGYMYPSGNIWFGNSSGTRWSRVACNDLYYYNYSTSSTRQIKSDIEYLYRKELRTTYSNDFKIERNIEREDFYSLFKDINFTTFIYDVKKGETGEQTVNRIDNGEDLTCGFIMEDLEEIENPVVPLIVKQEYDMEGNPVTEGVNQKRIDMNSYNNSIAIALQVAIEKIESQSLQIEELRKEIEILKNR